jgi:hypothetical protein
MEKKVTGEREAVGRYLVNHIIANTDAILRQKQFLKLVCMYALHT